MAKPTTVVLENSLLKVEVQPHDLATHVTVKSTRECLRMAGGQPDDVMMQTACGGVWRSMAGEVASLARINELTAEARLPGLGLVATVRLDAADVVFEIAPDVALTGQTAREVLWPRHFVLPRKPGAYAVFPFGAGSIIPSDYAGRFHHREGYAEAIAQWVGGYTGQTGYCGIAETPHDLYQAVDHRPGQAASVFFHWMGSLGELRYARRARFHFEKRFDYVRQAKHYRRHCQRIGWFRSMADKARENPNIRKMAGAPIITTSICSRRERTMEYSVNTFTDVAATIEQFRRATGIANAIVHVDGWGFWGYDAMHPDALPPHPEAGGAQGLSELARRVKALGYLFGLHDQYIDYYFHAPSYDQSWSIVLENGRPVRINRWCGGACGHLCYTQIPKYVRRNYYEGVHRVYPLNHNSPSIWELAAPTASYLDCFCRGMVECWSKDHPMTRALNRQCQNEALQLVRNGQDGQRVVLSVEHPADYSLPYLDFGWGIGHIAADVPNTQGTMETQMVGTPAPLWHLAFHDALCLPNGGNLLEALLYAQAPYFTGLTPGSAIAEEDLARKKVLLKLHQDAAFSEMTGHELLSRDGLTQKCVYDNGLEVEVHKAEGTYRISAGRAKTKGWQKL